MKNRILPQIALTASLLSAPSIANASYWFRVDDASRLQWLVDGSGVVYLRNLNAFDSSVLGCCYSYWIDPATPAGKVHWSTLLTRISTGQSVWISVNSRTQSGAIDFVANLD